MAMHSALRSELARRLAAESDLSYQDYEVLVTLTDQPDGRRRVMELAEILGWEKSRLSHHVTRMTKRGLVTKELCTEDRRGFVVVVTDLGRSEIEAAAPGHVEAVRDLFIDRLSPTQLEAMNSIARDVLAQFDNEEQCASKDRSRPDI